MPYAGFVRIALALVWFLRFSINLRQVCKPKQETECSQYDRHYDVRVNYTCSQLVKDLTPDKYICCFGKLPVKNMRIFQNMSTKDNRCNSTCEFG